MTPILVVLGLVVAVTAAARSTWSPCGLSMLSSLTPLAERGRGHRYRTTAAWFIVGGFLGGCALGGTAALLAIGARALGLSSTVALGTVAVAALIAVASDLGFFGYALPVHHRQVNERWLDQFRSWVYGMGFGFQIGMGLATYIMTAALYLLLVIAAVSQSVVVAMTLGAVFGTLRGLAVLLGRSITGPETLRSFHRRFHALGPTVRLLTIAVEGGCLAACLVAAWVPMSITFAAGAVFGACIYLSKAAGRLRRTPSWDEAGAATATSAPASAPGAAASWPVG